MSSLTVLDLAAELRKPVPEMLTQLRDAGVAVASADSPISPSDKIALLQHLQKMSRMPASPGAPSTLGAASRISIKRKETTELKLGGGRGAPTKTVSIEVRKRRTYLKSDEVEATEAAPAAVAAPPLATPSAEIETVAAVAAVDHAEPMAANPAEPASIESAADAATAARTAAEDAARLVRDEEAAKVRAVAEEADRVKTAEAERMRTDPIYRARMDAESSRRRAAENLRRATEVKIIPTPAPTPPAAAAAKKPERADRDKDRAGGGGDRGRELHLAAGKGGKRDKKTKRKPSGQIHVDNAHTFERPTAPVVREVEVPEAITVAELANRMAVKATELIKVMMKNGLMATINQIIDQDTAALMVEEMGHKIRLVKDSDVEDGLMTAATGEVQQSTSLPRPPVVTIMGHVDHGKTSLLDYIRKTRVAAGEAGGITQHIGAYHVATKKGVITFLDTPGHAAFTRMRARGAQLTDIVILIVAGDDGVMPQTKEAIQHAKAAGAPVIVAITKIDKPDADVARVKTELLKEELVAEDFGGEVQVVGVSSVSGAGIDDLLDAILLQAEVLELKAPIDTMARGTIVEASIEKGRGPVATVLVRAGTLRQGDVIISGAHYGRVRAMFNEAGQPVKEVGPSIPVAVLGLSGAPDAGDDIVVVADERKARELTILRESKQREAKLASNQAVRMDQVFARMGDGSAEQKSLNLMIKADVQGSAEALAESLRKLPSAEVKVTVVSSSIGGISESDVDLALASRAIIIGFNVRADSVARRRIQDTGLDVRYYSIIYDVLDDVSDAIGGLLGTETREQIVGTAQVRDVFRSSKFGAIAGCLVMDGEVRRGLPIRVLRSNVVIFEGELESLRRHKDDVGKVIVGTECGIGVKNYNDVKAGDQIECFDRIQVKRTVKAEA
ncbi:translation initiation factor IF-2 [Nevskia sp.]|uniref:translation initiation factor IF-2 n=1 Tax=Nevskia sp. TaxID=1929292 RepID=UPI0025F03669|nr:translation initiation factor IF-2 [Nevskia sp.]